MPDYTYRCLSCEAITPASHSAKESPVIPCERCGGLTRKVLLSAPSVLKSTQTHSAASSEKPSENSANAGHQCSPNCALHYPLTHWLNPEQPKQDSNS